MAPGGMGVDDWAYLAFGLLLSAALVSVVVHYFSRKRKKGIEEPKYKMLDDDE